MTPRRPTALVIGGSLAGLMTALTLSRVGVQVTVLERSGPERSRGGGLFITHGLVERVTGLRRAPTSLAGGMHAWHGIFTALYAAVEHDPGVSIVHDARVRSVIQDAVEARATTDDGRTFGADLVVGADGHRSVVRAVISPEHPDASFAGYVVWLAAIDEVQLPETLRGHRGFDSDVFLNGDNSVLLGGSFPGERAATVRGDRTVGWAVYDSTHNDFLRRDGYVQGQRVDHSVTDIPDDLVRELTAMNDAQWPSPWKETMRASFDAGLVIGTPISEYVPNRLADGRLAIVGDAAHVATPMTGRGFAEALDDAEALAAAIDSRRSIADALHHYEKKRLSAARSTVQSGQNFSRRFRPAA